MHMDVLCFLEFLSDGVKKSGRMNSLEVELIIARELYIEPCACASHPIHVSGDNSFIV